MAKDNSIDVFKGVNGEQVLFFKIPLEFQKWQSTLTQSEKDVYLYFMAQVHYAKSLRLEKDYEDIMYWTGLRTKEAVRNAIWGLAKQGWIEDIIYQKHASNIYIINLYPHVNEDLLERMERRSQNTSKAKKKSIAEGEKGKFSPK